MDYEKIVNLVIKAGECVFDTEMRNSVSMKGEADFLTAVDLNVSGFLKKELKAIAPDVSFMSEEDVGKCSDKRWILDPIDGTTNLVYDYRMSSVSLAYMENGSVIFGVVYNPYSRELFTAEKGKGTYLNGVPLGKAPDRPVKDCLVEFGAGSTKKEYADLSFSIGKKVFMECLDLRRICSTALAICFVAAGRMNGYFEWSIKPWDYAAAALILDECGGVSSDWNGGELQYDKGTSFVCGTSKAYEFLLSTIKEEMKK